MKVCIHGHRSPPGAEQCSTCGSDELDDLTVSVDLEDEPVAPPVSGLRTYEVRGGEHAVLVVEDESIAVGRDPGSPLSGFLAGYPNVGTFHAGIRAARGHLYLDVKVSRNGTFHHDEQLDAKEHRLALPATVRLGSNCYLTVSELATPPPAGACPDPT